jgi:hypothetical protein
MRQSLISIIVISISILLKDTSSDGISKNLQVIFIFEDWPHSFSLPDVDNSITDHASVATRSASTKWMGMVNIKIGGEALDHEPWLVSRKDGTCAVELLDVKGASLSPRRSISNLKRSKRD